MPNTHDRTHTPSESDLRAVFNRCRLSGWPDRFEDAMTDPLIRRYVDTLARRGPAYLRGGLNRPTPLQQTNTYLASLPTPQRRAGVDLKSRAAGERDDIE